MICLFFLCIHLTTKRQLSYTQLYILSTFSLTITMLCLPDLVSFDAGFQYRKNVPTTRPTIWLIYPCCCILNCIFFLWRAFLHSSGNCYVYCITMIYVFYVVLITRVDFECSILCSLFEKYDQVGEKFNSYWKHKASDCF